MGQVIGPELWKNDPKTGLINERYLAGMMSNFLSPRPISSFHHAMATLVITMPWVFTIPWFHWFSPCHGSTGFRHAIVPLYFVDLPTPILQETVSESFGSFKTLKRFKQREIYIFF